jgi:hypothetical protein
VHRDVGHPKSCIMGQFGNCDGLHVIYQSGDRRTFAEAAHYLFPLDRPRDLRNELCTDKTGPLLREFGYRSA